MNFQEFHQVILASQPDTAFVGCLGTIYTGKEQMIWNQGSWA